MRSELHKDKTVVVTGAASGIGRGIATQFAEEGADTVIADISREPKQGENFEIAEEIPTDELIQTRTGNESVFIQTDVVNISDVKNLISETTKKFSGIDVLVNNAGIHIAGSSQEISIDEWEQVIDINLKGAFNCAKFAIPHLIDSEGALINIGSINSLEGGSGPPYSSSKAGVVNLTRDLAVELGKDNVNTNAICPGVVKTPMNDFLSEEEIVDMRSQTLLPRFGEGSDIGNVAVFLASEEASFIHGEAIYVDGGWTAHR